MGFLFLCIVLVQSGVAHSADDAALCADRAGESSIAACTRRMARSGLSPLELAVAYANRGMARDGGGDPNGALADFDEAIRRDGNNVVARDNRARVVERLARDMNKRASALSDAGQYDEAIALARQALALQEREDGEDSPKLIETLANLARFHERQGNASEARRFYTRVLTVQRNAAGAVARRQLESQESRSAETQAQAKERMDSRSLAISRPPPVPAPPSAARTSQPDGESQIMDAPVPLTQALPQSKSPVLPEFPWPPPAASASYVLPRDSFTRRDTVGQVADAIIFALERSGYVERSFFGTKADGVALVTRIERMNSDGTPSAPRWPAWRNSQNAFNLEQFLRGLFYVDRGRYRVIVFVLQDKPFSQSPSQVMEHEARAWLQSGANMLPREIADRPYGESDCTALIYEFASDGVTVHTVDSSLTGKEHLDKAGIMASLAKSP